MASSTLPTVHDSFAPEPRYKIFPWTSSKHERTYTAAPNAPQQEASDRGPDLENAGSTHTRTLYHIRVEVYVINDNEIGASIGIPRTVAGGNARCAWNL